MPSSLGIRRLLRRPAATPAVAPDGQHGVPTPADDASTQHSAIISSASSGNSSGVKRAREEGEAEQQAVSPLLSVQPMASSGTSVSSAEVSYTCAVCLRTAGPAATRLPCSHMYCTACIVQAVKATDTKRCPQCRKPFTLLQASTRDYELENEIALAVSAKRCEPPVDPLDEMLAELRAGLGSSAATRILRAAALATALQTARAALAQALPEVPIDKDRGARIAVISASHRQHTSKLRAVHEAGASVLAEFYRKLTYLQSPSRMADVALGARCAAGYGNAGSEGRQALAAMTDMTYTLLHTCLPRSIVQPGSTLPPPNYANMSAASLFSSLYRSIRNSKYGAAFRSDTCRGASLMLINSAEMMATARISSAATAPDDDVIQSAARLSQIRQRTDEPQAAAGVAPPVFDASKLTHAAMLTWCIFASRCGSAGLQTLWFSLGSSDVEGYVAVNEDDKSADDASTELISGTVGTARGPIAVASALRQIAKPCWYRSTVMLHALWRSMSQEVHSGLRYTVARALRRSRLFLSDAAKDVLCSVPPGYGSVLLLHVIQRMAEMTRQDLRGVTPPQDAEDAHALAQLILSAAASAITPLTSATPTTAATTRFVSLALDTASLLASLAARQMCGLQWDDTAPIVSAISSRVLGEVFDNDSPWCPSLPSSRIHSVLASLIEIVRRTAPPQRAARGAAAASILDAVKAIVRGAGTTQSHEGALPRARALLIGSLLEKLDPGRLAAQEDGRRQSGSALRLLSDFVLYVACPALGHNGAVIDGNGAGNQSLAQLLSGGRSARDNDNTLEFEDEDAANADHAHADAQPFILEAQRFAVRPSLAAAAATQATIASTSSSSPSDDDDSDYISLSLDADELGSDYEYSPDEYSDDDEENDDD